MSRTTGVHDGEPALRKIELQNILSFRDVEINLSHLNVLVGPNGAGKSNLLRVISFMGAIARLDLLPAIEFFGGFKRLLFAGETKSRTIKIKFEATVTKYSSAKAKDVYEISFWSRNNGNSHIVSRNETFAFKRYAGRGRRITVRGGKFYFQEIGPKSNDAKKSIIPIGTTSAGLATLRKLGESYGAEQADQIAKLFEDFRVFEVDAQRAAQPSFRHKSSPSLLSNASNLASYLYHINQQRPDIFKAISDDLREVVPSVEGLEVRSYGAGQDEGFIVELRETGLKEPTPLAAASFGTVRALSLFAMLHDPNPPLLTCMEEIDHGLHPHALDRVVDRLREASTRTQIIAVTHSPALVNRLRPEELIVFERGETGETIIPFIDAEEIKKAEEASGLGLGEMWFSGALGGSL